MPKKYDYSGWSKEDLIKRVHELEKRKKYGLVWDEEREPEQVVLQCKKELPILKEVKEKEIKNDPDEPTHILIEGDNYHALSVLNYTHENSVDVIYIDPPYNTGARDWTYNNNYVDKNDAYRHSKWISFILKRAQLAKNLLKPDGIILIAIDDHEVHHLRMILDEIFGENNFISTICVEVNPAGQNIRENSPAISHDYCLIYAKSIDKVEIIPRLLTRHEKEKYKEKDDDGYFLWDNLRRRGGNSTPKDRPGQWFPLYVNFEKKHISLTEFPNSLEIWPIDPKGIKRIWRVNPDGFKREYALGRISLLQKKDRIEIVKKSYQPKGKKPKTLWKDPSHSATSHGTKLLIDILGSNSFSYPKSVHLIKDCLMYWSKPNSVILDFFAGSGTTGHAVLELNKIDDGKRQFILCTNNENNICENVCFPRLDKVIKGYGGNVKYLLQEKKITLSTLKKAQVLIDEIETVISNFSDSYDKIESEVVDNYLRIFGIKNKKNLQEVTNNNLKYFRTDFVPAISTDTNKEKLTKQSVEMLCLRENSYEPMLEDGPIKIFQNKEKYTAILFDQLAIPKLKEIIQDYNKHIHVYIFSLGDDDFADEFMDIKDKVTVKSIPAAILRVYRRIFK